MFFRLQLVLVLIFILLQSYRRISNTTELFIVEKKLWLISHTAKQAQHNVHLNWIIDLSSNHIIHVGVINKKKFYTDSMF